MAKLWSNASGDLFRVDGDLIADTVCPECVCAPCDCPCVTWPPVEWPCAGLLEEYAISDWFFGTYCYASSDCTGTLEGNLIGCSTFEDRIRNTCVLTAAASPACKWTGLLQKERRTYSTADGWSAWANLPDSYITLTLTSCEWRLAGFSFSYIKAVGKNPSGVYSNLNTCMEFTFGSGIFNQLITIS